MTLLDPEKRKVYDAALNFVVLAEQIAAKAPRGLGFTDDERASEARSQLVEIVSMLVSMISGLERAGSRERARAN